MTPGTTTQSEDTPKSSRTPGHAATWLGPDALSPGHAADAVITIRGVNKAFAKRPAVIDLNLQVPRGCVFGLLGHNGAGKSTTLGMLLGQVYPDTGALTIHGHDVFAHRSESLRKVGAIFEAPVFYDYLTGMTNLRALQALTGPIDQQRVDYVVDWVKLTPRIHDRVGTYSHGMRQRLALAQALIHEPELLILDEPTDGLDPEGIHEMREMVRRLNREMGLTILFSSHLLGEVEQVCSHVGVMRQGRLLFSGKWDRFDAAAGLITLRCNGRQAAVELLKTENLLDAGFAGPSKTDVYDARPKDRYKLCGGVTIARVAERLVTAGHAIEALAPVELTLEEFYLQLRAEDRI